MCKHFFPLVGADFNLFIYSFYANVFRMRSTCTTNSIDSQKVLFMFDPPHLHRFFYLSAFT